jgi:hypothetical protein
MGQEVANFNRNLILVLLDVLKLAYDTLSAYSALRHRRIDYNERL